MTCLIGRQTRSLHQALKNWGQKLESSRNPQSLFSAAILAGLLSAYAIAPKATIQCVPHTEEPVNAVSLTATSPIETLCKDGAKPAFSGDVQDGFGHTISVCIAAAEDGNAPIVTIRSSGESGETSLSCSGTSCAGVIEFTHYCRYRFTELSLKWYQNGSKQVLTESFDAQDPEGAVNHSVTHSWAIAESIEHGLEAEPHTVVAVTEPLSMLVLKPYLLGATLRNGT